MPEKRGRKKKENNTEGENRLLRRSLECSQYADGKKMYEAYGNTVVRNRRDNIKKQDVQKVKPAS